MGAVGALSSKMELGAASLSANQQGGGETIMIPVLLVPNAGSKKGKSVLVPAAAASRQDEVVWEPQTEDIERIVKVKFKAAKGQDALPNPFSDTEAMFDNDGEERRMRKTVLLNAAEGTYWYRIWVKEHNGGVIKSEDPPLDIVPPV